MVGGPAANGLQRVGVELAEYDVPSVLVGGVHGPEPALVHHEVDVRVAAPRVMVHVVVAGEVELSGVADERRAEVKLDDGVALKLVEVNGSVVNDLTGARPRVRQAMRREVICCHEVVQRLVLPHKAIIVITIHVPNLQQRQTDVYFCKIFCNGSVIKTLYKNRFKPA